MVGYRACHREALIAALLLFSAPALAAECDTQLVLAIDVSGSISDENYVLQRDGIAQALTDRRVIHAAMSGPSRCSEIAVLEWSDVPPTATTFMRLDSPAAAQQVATAISGLPRASSGATGLYAAVKAARSLFTCETCRRVIDVSGDGKNNSPGPALIVSDLADEGVVVNGLAIVSDEKDVADWYHEHVRTPDGFVITVDGFQRFGDAMRRKLEAEIAGLKPIVQLVGGF